MKYTPAFKRKTTKKRFVPPADADELARLGDTPDGNAAVDNFAIRVTKSWQKQVPTIIETGKILIEAKGTLRHGQWGKLFEKNRIPRAPFSQSTARELMAIAEHPIISNPQHVANLPELSRPMLN